MFEKQGFNAEPNRIRVTVYNGVVLLIGQVPSEQIRATAHQVAQSVAGIKNVINELTVQRPINASTIATDSVVSTRVRADLARVRDFKSTHLTIVVENSSVYLLGLMTDEEQHIAVTVTSNVSGVKRVVKIMEKWN
jgi:osmotically-inducible protein OsmY